MLMTLVHCNQITFITTWDRSHDHMVTWFVQSLITHCTLCWTFFTLSTSVLIETIIYRFRKNNYRQMPLRNVRHWTVDPTESTCYFIHRAVSKKVSLMFDLGLVRLLIRSVLVVLVGNNCNYSKVNIRRAVHYLYRILLFWIIS